MKNKIISIISIFAISVMMLAGCGTGAAEKNNTTAENSAALENSSAAGNSVDSENAVTAENSVELENSSTTESINLEPNIIDDNYRNYYEIFVASFYDSDGDGMGDLKGVTEKLDYIENMGFTGIWLMPIMPSPSYHKYDVTDYYAVDSEYGTIDDFDELITEAHKRGINVIIDMVMNHSSSQNKWFTDACDYLETLSDNQKIDTAVCPYAEYYNFSREKLGDTYYQAGNSDFYYEGQFTQEMPDLNFESSLVTDEFQNIAKFWISHGVDGFRMDAVTHYKENDISFNNDVLSSFYEYCKSLDPDFYLVSEAWTSESDITKYYGSGTPSFFNFDAGNSEGKLIKAARGKYSATKFVNAMLQYQEDFGGANPDYIDAPFITNHDQGRVANTLMQDENDIKMAGGLLMTMSGSPFVYYGEEIGMSGKGTKDENKRLSYIWSDSDNAGKTNDPSGADSGITSSFAGEKEQESDETSILNYYKNALQIRNAFPEIARGTISVIDDLCLDDIAVITKTYNDCTIGIIYNTSDETLMVDTANSSVEDMTIAAYMSVSEKTPKQNKTEIEMPGQSICIVE